MICNGYMTNDSPAGVIFMERYAPIGKLMLKNAIGLQKNRKEIEYRTVSRLDEKASGCFECPNYSIMQVYKDKPESDAYLSAQYACSNCGHCVYKEVVEEHVKYVNEGNRYATKIGYSKTLKANGLKLLLVIHMMHPNRYGHVFDLNISDLKDILGCDRKTIISNLDNLMNYDYIEYVKTNRRGHINVIIKGYDSYFKTAREGGRGYMTFSLELIEALLTIKDLTTLRLFLHQLIDTDNFSDTPHKVFKKTYHELLNCLPGYYKPNHIRKGLSHNMENPIFQLNVGSSVTFKLNPDYNARKVKEQLIQDSRIRISNHLEELNDKFDLINASDARPEDVLPEIFYKEKRPSRYENYSINRTSIEELGKMAWQFPLYDILDAIDYIYVNFVLPHKGVENYPGLVRSLIPEIRESRTFYQLAA